MAEQATETQGTQVPTQETGVSTQAATQEPTQGTAGTLLSGQEAQSETEETKPETKSAVPEKYDFKAPEGLTLDQAGIDAFTPVAKELGLSNEQAQKLVDLYGSRMSEQFKAIQTQQAEAFVKQQESWMAEFKADKDFGGERLDASLQQAEGAWKHFATQPEIEAIHKAGLANYPPLVKILARVGKEMGEGSFHQGGAVPVSDKAKRMFPNMN